jgi:predicted ArsR family transcriptional regulator
LYSCVDSFDHLEILLLLHRSAAARTAREIASDLALSHDTARAHLETLAARGLVEIAIAAEPAYRYAPRNDDLRRHSEQLALYYVQAPATILRRLASGPGRSVKRFADAFRLREPKP